MRHILYFGNHILEVMRALAFEQFGCGGIYVFYMVYFIHESYTGHI